MHSVLTMFKMTQKPRQMLDIVPENTATMSADISWCLKPAVLYLYIYLFICDCITALSFRINDVHHSAEKNFFLTRETTPLSLHKYVTGQVTLQKSLIRYNKKH